MDPARLFEILSVSGGRSAHFNYDFPRVLEDDYTPGFKTSLALKDINLILDLAEAEDYQSVLAPVIASLYQRAVDNGSGDEHFTSVVKLYQEAARAADSQST
jgi:3-hydroxyisobutyrate dehydrogenase